MANFLDFVFPKKCVSCKKVGDYICTNCFSYLSFSSGGVCLVCNKSALDGLTHPGCVGKYTIDGSFSSLSYNPIAKKLIYRFKYKPYIFDLHGLLAELFYEGIIQNETLAKTIEQSSNQPANATHQALLAGGTIILVPVPLHKSKLKKRGYNQAEILAKGLSVRLGIPCNDILIRNKNTRTQFKLDRKERIENMKNAFAFNSKLITNNSKLEGKTIFLVDDILTTGSTLSSAANLLKRAGTKAVFGLTLAREQ